MRSIFTQKQLLRSKMHNIKKMPREFPGCSVVRTPHFHYQDPCSVSSRRTKVPQAMQCRPKKKEAPIFCTILFMYSVTKNIFKFSSQEHKQWLLFRLDFYIKLCKGMNSSPLPVGMVIQYYGEITLQLS